MTIDVGAKVTRRSDADELAIRAELTRRARELVPLLKKNAAECDRSRRIPQENMDAIEAAGLIRILMPARLGGFQCTFRTRLDVMSILAEGCGSTSWVYYILSDLAWVVGTMPERVQREVFGDDKNAKVMGQVTPVGSARRVEGGVRVTAKSFYATGSQFADWVMLPSLEVDEGGAVLGPLAMLVPAKDYRIEDTWHVSGMRGTASACVVVEDVFVPAHLVFSLPDLAAGKYREFHDEVTFGAAFIPALSLSTAPIHLGLARAALAHTIEMADKRAVPYSRYARQTESVAFQVLVAQAALKIEGAQALAEKWFDTIDRAAQDERALTIVERATVRAVSGQVARETIAAVNTLLTAHGTASFAESNPMQRIWRDINIIARHGFVSHALGDEVLGCALLGGDPMAVTNSI